jgi:hypothetical protein
MSSPFVAEREQSDFTGSMQPGTSRNCSMKKVSSRLAKIARDLVRFDHIARVIENANHSIM